MDGKSLDTISEKITQLKKLFPEIFSEGKIDCQRLKQILGENILVQNEHYQLSWAGKSEARKEIQKQTTATLVPQNEAENLIGSKHIFIEGENLEVLRILQKSYFGKVKMIYIDPPYNTGNDSFVYPDNYAEKQGEYKKRTGMTNEEGFLNKQDLWKKNSKENGQFHSVWLSMMYPRLYLSRNLLKKDGVIFISIDDNEAANLKLLCDEILGEENFIGQFIWVNRTTPNDAGIGFATDHEYIIAYSKNASCVVFKGTAKDLSHYKNPDNDENGEWTADNPSAASGNESYRFPIINPYTEEIYYPPQGRFWAFSPKRVEEWTASGKLVFPKEKGKNFLLKKYKHELKSDFKPISSVIQNILTSHGTKELKSLFEQGSPFKYPKPSKLLKMLIAQITHQEDIIVDFFAGSGTTAQAVMELNEEYGSNRQFICVQMPEIIDEKSENYSTGYKTIADITKARIEKVIEKIGREKVGCQHFVLAKSNFKIWQNTITDGEEIAVQLFEHQQTEKPESQSDNMFVELCLKLGLGLNAPYFRENGFYKIEKNLWFCFEPYTENHKKAILENNPQKVVFLSSCFIHDADLSNFQWELQEKGIDLVII